MLEHAPGVTRRSRKTVNDAARQAASLSTSGQPTEARLSEDGWLECYSAALRRDSSRAFPPSRDGAHLTDGTTTESLTPQVHYHSLRAPIDYQPRSRSGKAQEPPQETSGQKLDVLQDSLYRAFESGLDFYSSRVEIVKTPLPDLPATLKTEIIRLSRDQNQQWPVVIRVSDYAVGNLINGVVILQGPDRNHLVACLMRCRETRKQEWSMRLAASREIQSSDGTQKKSSHSEDLHVIMHYLASMVRDAQASSVPADRAPAHRLVEDALPEMNPSQSKQSPCRRQRESQLHDTSNPEKRLRISSQNDGHIAPVDLHDSQPATLLPRQYQFYHSVERHYAMLEKQLDDEWPHRLEKMM
ncbi:hypothetical protein KC343_g13375 [Hortaea werneckii]|nr:hypothetical protein KC352_g24377 [Hortaea werneckii]KAI7548304.1 hypothetical protein KC317_g14889 [Hortaea werneckii]KAI7600361.1 hypothetical protein KC346_g13297 [Hortaea werneckii]KAI7606548.1 hypothetical protein KC343_g13375 [Hortaea werneckii]KAI7642339.1 hypothetical protein KC319_g13088 [Hortaea werneckii]